MIVRSECHIHQHGRPNRRGENPAGKRKKKAVAHITLAHVLLAKFSWPQAAAREVSN